MPEDSLTSVVASNVRRLREERGWTQEEAARRLRARGLDWGRNSLAALEHGTRKIDIEEFVLLAAAFEISASSLFASDLPRVSVSDLRIKGTRLPDLLGPSPAAALDGAISPMAPILSGALVGVGEDMAAAEPPIPYYLEAFGVRPTKKNIAAAADAATGAAATYALRRLGLTDKEFGALSIAMWGHALVDERDQRAGPGASAMKKSWTTRRLVEEMAERAIRIGLVELDDLRHIFERRTDQEEPR